jgi:hypothetical protein
MLDRAIKLHFSRVYVRFSSSPAGRKAEKEWASNNEPLPTGYYRAFLSRTKEKEIIVYSPDPKKDSLKKLISRKAKK